MMMLKQGAHLLNCDITLTKKDALTIGEAFNTTPVQLIHCSVATSTNNQPQIQIDGTNNQNGINNILLVTPILTGVIAKENIQNNEINNLSVKPLPLHNELKINTDNSEDPLLDEVLDFDCISPGRDEIGVHKINDKPVFCRAKASLPAKFLYICRLTTNCSDDKIDYAVYAKKSLPKKTVFGPMEGEVTEYNSTSDENLNELKLLIFDDDEGLFKKLDVSDSNVSNWMKFVKPARNIVEQNLILYQNGRNLFFSTVKKVAPNEELKVWYSSSYAKLRNLKMLPEIADLNEITKSQHECSSLSQWCCSHCGTSFNSAALLNLHVLTHAADNVETTGTDISTRSVSKTKANLEPKIENLEENVADNIANNLPDNITNNLADNITNNLADNITDNLADTITDNLADTITDNLADTITDNLNDNGGDNLTDNLADVADNIEDNDQLFNCNRCSKSFTNLKSLETHLMSPRSGEPYECPVCKNTFLKLKSLRNHIPMHLVDGYFTCPHCEKKFKAYKMIRNHIRTYHAERKFHCLQCPKFFYTLAKLKIHMLSHSELRKFLCANCGKQFKRKDKLSDHMKRIHLSGNEKTINKRIRTKVNKKTMPHKEMGSKDFESFVYKCHICIIGFKRRGMLVNHLANRHPEITPSTIPELSLPILKANKDYYCQYCDKIYKSSSKRKAHILKNHPGEKLPVSSRKVPTSKEGEENGTFSQTIGSVTANPHSCEWCHKQYASKAKLLQHQRKKHNEKLPKTLQVPKKKTPAINFEDDIDTVNVGRVSDSDILLFQEPLDTHISDGEFIIDANTLKRALKGEDFIDASPETLAELGQLIENRPDQYFRVYHTSTGITFARPVEVWDALSTCQTLSPADDSPTLGELKLN